MDKVYKCPKCGSKNIFYGEYLSDNYDDVLHCYNCGYEDNYLSFTTEE